MPFREDVVTILEFDDAGFILRYRSYYDKLGVLDQITSGMSGIHRP